MKTLRITLSISLHVDVPDDSTLDADALVRDIARRANDWNDGRYPYATELLQEGALRLVHSVIDGEPWLANVPSISGWRERPGSLAALKIPVFWGDDRIEAKWVGLPENWVELLHQEPENWVELLHQEPKP